MSKKNNTNSTQVIAEDQRGRHDNRANKYPLEIVQGVEDHINKYPVMDSHYCRETTQRKFLEEGLSITKMYKMYVSEKKRKRKTGQFQQG